MCAVSPGLPLKQCNHIVAVLLDTPLSSKMPKLMQKIVLFVEPQQEKYGRPLKIGNLFMNRFSIDEDRWNELLKIYYLENAFWDYTYGRLTKNEGSDRI